jgi:hypothetical protein
MIFIPTKLSPMEYDIKSEVSEDIHVYYKHLCKNTRLGKYKRIEPGFKRGTLCLSLII